MVIYGCLLQVLFGIISLQSVHQVQVIIDTILTNHLKQVNGLSGTQTF